MSQNIISQTMTDAQRDAMIGDFTAFATKWELYLCTLTADEIRRLFKIAPEDIGLLEMAETYVAQNPDAIPGNVPVAEMSKDIALAKQVMPVNAKAQQQADRTHCTLIAVMSDAFKVAREVYRIAQARGRTPENATFLDAFGARFARGPQPAKQPTP